MEFISSSQMRSLEENAEKRGISRLELMENAGKKCAEVISTLKPNSKILILCGKGNNGGDGLVCARYLADKHNVSVYLVGEIEKPEAKKNLERLKGTNVKIVDKIEDKYDIFVDALLGIGAKGRLRGEIKKCVKKINKLNGIKVSLDIPTGMDPDTGEICDIAVKPDLTITFHRAKKGMEKGGCGKIIVLDIGIPHFPLTKTTAQE